MSFKVGDKVRLLDRTGVSEGTVEASNVAHSPARYLVSYASDAGVNYKDWIQEDHLGATADSGAAPAEGTATAGSEGGDAAAASAAPITQDSAGEQRT